MTFYETELFNLLSNSQSMDIKKLYHAFSIKAKHSVET